MLDLNKDVKYIKGVGPARAELLNSIGIFNLYDLITYFPKDYEDRGKEYRRVRRWGRGINKSNMRF